MFRWEREGRYHCTKSMAHNHSNVHVDRPTYFINIASNDFDTPCHRQAACYWNDPRLTASNPRMATVKWARTFTILPPQNMKNTSIYTMPQILNIPDKREESKNGIQFNRNQVRFKIVALKGESSYNLCLKKVHSGNVRFLLIPSVLLYASTHSYGVAMHFGGGSRHGSQKTLTHSNEDPKYLFPRGNKALLYHQIGNRNFFIFITNQ